MAPHTEGQKELGSKAMALALSEPFPAAEGEQRELPGGS